MRRLDVYLTRKARASWPASSVFEDGERWILDGIDGREVILAGPETPAEYRFHTAREALALLRESIGGKVDGRKRKSRGPRRS